MGQGLAHVISRQHIDLLELPEGVTAIGVKLRLTRVWTDSLDS